MCYCLVYLWTGVEGVCSAPLRLHWAAGDAGSIKMRPVVNGGGAFTLVGEGVDAPLQPMVEMLHGVGRREERNDRNVWCVCVVLFSLLRFPVFPPTLS